MPVNQNKQCTLINKSGKDIAVVVAVGYDETIGSNVVVTSNGQLEILKTGKGSTVIKNGDSDTVTLDHSYKPDAEEKGDVQTYNLTISDTNWLYPLVNLPVAPQTDNGNSGYAPQSVTSIGTAMAQAFAFYQVIAAYPDSQLATDYTTALQAANDAALAKADGTATAADAVAGAIEETVNAFFKKKKEYGQVTLADMVAADKYYKSFPAVWAQYKDSLTYYIYSSDDKTAGFAGTLSLQKSGPLDVTKANGGYTCTFTPSVNPADPGKTDVDSGKATALTYANGLFVDDAKATTPKIAFKGAFMRASLFTANQDDNTIIIVMSGNINGALSIGFNSPQGISQPAPQAASAVQTSSDIEKYWNTLLHPRNQQELIVSIMTLVGAILLIPAMAGAVYGIYRVVKYKAAVKEALSREIVEHTRAEMNARAIEEMLDTSVTYEIKLGNWLGDFYVEFNPKNIQGYQRVVQNNSLADKLTDALEMQEDSLREALKFSSQMGQDDITSINESLTTIRDSVTTLRESPRTELEKVLPDQVTAYKQVSAKMMEVYFNLDSILSKEAKAMIIENSDLSQGICKQVEESFHADAADGTDDDPVAPEHYKPEEEEIF